MLISYVNNLIFKGHPDVYVGTSYGMSLSIFIGAYEGYYMDISCVNDLFIMVKNS